MFDFDAGKLTIVGIVALIVIGPKELPRVMLQVGQAGQVAAHGGRVSQPVMDAMHEAEIDDIKSPFGSVLVIVPFLQQGLVQEYRWLDERQFLIAVEVGMCSAPDLWSSP